MNALDRFERGMTRLLEGVITLLFLAIFLLTVILVLLRYGFNETIVGGNELMNYLFIYTTAIGAAVSLGRGTHIKISYLLDKTGGKTRKTIVVINLLLLILLNAVMIRYSLPWIRSTGAFMSPVLQIPSWTVQISVPVGCALAIVYCGLRIRREIAGPAAPSGDERKKGA